MNIWKSIAGMLEAELTSADPAQTLQSINQQNIQLYQVRSIGELSVQFLFSGSDYQKLEAFCRKRGIKLKICRRKGLRYIGHALIIRPVLLTGFLLLLTATLLLPTRIFFFHVEGNNTIPERRILAAAEACGISFGISRREVRSEKMKNALLDALPELKWAGINTAGCTAVISVRERMPEEMPRSAAGFSSIVANRDGYILSSTVTQGNSLCTVGQVVTKGQILISGYTDCGLSIQVTDAEGEIYAQTRRILQAASPSRCTVKTQQSGSARDYSLIVGKKRINLWKCSGISDTSCGRMYEEYYITLPGGFRLPICLAVETITSWETAAQDITADSAAENMKAFSRRRALQQMTAGQILREFQTVQQKNGSFILRAEFICTEMIGEVITEEIGEFNGKID